MNKLFVCEKSDQAKKVMKTLSFGDTLILAPSISAYLFKYPKQLHFKNTPFFDKSPEYKINYESNYFLKSVVCIFKEDKQSESSILQNYLDSMRNNLPNIKESRDNLISFLSSFDEIIYACDSDHTGMRGFDLLFSQYFKIPSLKSFSINNNVEFSFLNLLALDDNSLHCAYFNKKSIFDPSSRVALLRNAYSKKDFFDYNYNLNSLMLIERAYSLAFDSRPGMTITRNMISLLTLLSKLNSDQHFYSHYLVKKNIGSPVSSNKIVELLLDIGLIEWLKEKHNQTIILSSKGALFLEKLHRRIKNPHLASTLFDDIYKDEFSCLDFKEKYSTYLKKSFSSQKKLNNKHQH